MANRAGRTKPTAYHIHQYYSSAAPMDIISTGDEYNHRGELALAGVANVEKVVDDILGYTSTFKEHVTSVIEVLRRCQE